MIDPAVFKTARMVFGVGARPRPDRIVVLSAALALLCAATNVRASDVPPVFSLDCPSAPPCVPVTPQVVPPGQCWEGVPVVPPGGEQPTGQLPTDMLEGVDRAGPLGDAGPSLPSGLGAVAAAESPAVHMIGDFFGSGYFLGADDGFSTVPAAGGDRRFKATDNLNPLPQDRVFFNYHHFHNAVSDVTGANRSADRFTFGLERTFFDQIFSFEVRFPFTSGLDNVQLADTTDTISLEFGNVALTVKALMFQRGSLTFTSGLATILPTAADASVEGTAISVVSRLSVLENNAVHLQPYLGINYSNQCSRLFSTAYVAVDVDLNGNEVLTGSRLVGGPSTLVSLGDVRDPTLLFFDWQVGYWWYQDYGHTGYLNGIAPVFEVHYSRALEDPVDVGGVYQNPFGTADLLNLTGGFLFDIRRTSTLAVYGAAPLQREEAVLFGRPVSPVFQAEFGVQFVYRY